MKINAVRLIIPILLLAFCSSATAGVKVEYQDVQAFVRTNSDVLLQYEFHLEPDPSTPDYEFLPVNLPRDIYTGLKAFVRSSERAQWRSTNAQPAAREDSSNEIWVDIREFASSTFQIKVEVLMNSLAAQDAFCESRAGVLVGFTSFKDEDSSSKSRLRVHLPAGLTANDAVGYMDSEDKYMPIIAQMDNDHPVIELTRNGKMSYYWVYTLFSASSISVPLKPDWRYRKDSEPRLIPREKIQMDAWLTTNNITNFDIRYTAENTHSCLPVREITYWMTSRGTAFATKNGRRLNSKSRGRSTKAFKFFLDEPYIQPGETSTIEISARQSHMIYRIPEDPEFVTYSITPNIFATENPLPGSVWKVRVFLFPETELNDVTAVGIPFTGRGRDHGRPYVYWDLNERKLVGVKFPRGSLKSVSGRFDLSRPSEWLVVIREVRAVQIFLAVVIAVIAWSHWKSKRKRRS